MPEFTITTSRLILMHTSLAYLSPEIRAFDSILRDSLVGKLSIVPARLRLPTELLLLIRHHLLPTLTTHLFERSAQALSLYESSLRTLLCQDCLLYYQEVYGPDIWGWDHFTGACLCRKVKGSVDHDQAENPATLEYCDLWNQEQAFPNFSAWLELYLSFESSRLAGCQNSFHSIWDVVDVVLEDHGCRLSDNVKQSSHFGHYRSLRERKITIDVTTPVTVVPSLSALENNYSAPTILQRANHDLGLSFAYERGLEIWRPDHFHLRSPSFTKPSPAFTSSVQSQIAGIFTAVTAVVAAMLSLPLTFATMALTVVCYYYSNSRALRIL